MYEDDNQIHVPPSFLAVYADSRQRLRERGRAGAQQGADRAGAHQRGAIAACAAGGHAVQPEAVAGESSISR